MNVTLLFYQLLELNEPVGMKLIFKERLEELDITGKVVIAKTGYNVTCCGSANAITLFIDFVTDLFQLPTNPAFVQAFFKPQTTNFNTFDSLTVRVANELCALNCPINPLAYNPQVKHVSPSEFHLLAQNTQLLDLRNYYETGLGRFVGSICPPIRKFSSLPQWLQTQSGFAPRILTVCTGGIRCDLAANYIQEVTNSEIFVLEGGIHNYLVWADQNNIDSRFKGVNYVFDNRVSEQIAKSTNLSVCRKCLAPSSNLVQCIGTQCCLFFTKCPECVKPFCCNECEQMDLLLRDQPKRSVPGIRRIKRTACECDKARLLRFETNMFASKLENV